MKVNRKAGFLVDSKSVKNLEDVLVKNANTYGLEGSEYIIRIQNITSEGIEFYVRPSDRDGETVNFIIKGNNLTTKT